MRFDYNNKLLASEINSILELLDNDHITTNKLIHDFISHTENDHHNKIHSHPFTGSSVFINKDTISSSVIYNNHTTLNFYIQPSFNNIGFMKIYNSIKAHSLISTTNVTNIPEIQQQLIEIPYSGGGNIYDIPNLSLEAHDLFIIDFIIPFGDNYIYSYEDKELIFDSHKNYDKIYASVRILKTIGSI